MTSERQIYDLGDRRLSRMPPRRRSGLAAAACVVLGLGVGYAAGRERPAMHEEDVYCLSMVSGSSCSDEPDSGHAEFWVSPDVAWSDAGGLHHGGHPACLPPTGRGTQGPVSITWVTAEFEGRSLKQVVGVSC